MTRELIDIEKDSGTSYDGMMIIEKYERVIQYLYPLIQNFPRKHGILRDKFLGVLLEQPNLFLVAAKSSHPLAKLYEADAGLANLRFYLRMSLSLKTKSVTEHQQAVAQVLIAECGNILGQWLKRKQKEQHKK
jgi:hypothetical protein